MHKKNIAFARGDGIGPEIMDVTLRILQAAQLPFVFHEVEIGEKVYLRGKQPGWVLQRGTFCAIPMLF